MKKLVLFLLTFLCLVNVDAQTISPEDRALMEKDSIDLYNEIEQPYTKDCGSIPKTVVNAIVRYNTHADAYIELDNSLEFQGQLTLTGEGFGSKTIDLEGNSVKIKDLPLNLTLKLVTQNSCEEEVVLADIKTFYSNTGTVKVPSQRLFDFINKWASQENNGSSLTDFILGIRDVTRDEKLHFLQEYYIKDNPYPDDVTDEVISSTIEEGSRVTSRVDCDCNILELHTSDPFLSKGNTNLPNGPVIASQPFVIKKNAVPFSFPQKYEEAYKGPAKSISFEMGNTGFGANNQKMLVDGLEDPTSNKFFTSPLSAVIQYSLLCLGQNQNVSNCDCEKEITVGYEYATRLESTAAKIFCPYCFNKKSFAKAEDWAGVVVEDVNGLKPVAFGAANVISDCEYQVNKDFILNTLALAGVIATTALTGGTALAAIPVLEPAIGKVLTTEPFDVNKCKSESRKAILISGSTTMVLKPNKVAKARLFSFNAIELGVKSAAKAAAKINSNFYLATLIPGGAGGTMKNCCSNRKADWLAASFANSPNNDNELKNKVNLFANTIGLNANSTVGRNQGTPQDYTAYCGYKEGIRFK